MKTTDSLMNTNVVTGHLWPSNSLADALSTQARRKPEGEAVVYGDIRLNFSQLNNRSLAIAEQLRDLGVKRFDKVGVLYPNDPEFIAVFFAVVRLGATLVPINPMLKSNEIAHILTDSGSSAVIVHHQMEHEVLAALPQISGLSYMIVAGKHVTTDGVKVDAPVVRLQMTEKDSPSTEVKVPDDINPERDLALLVYTSGTTGKPKGAMLSHNCVMSVFPFNIFSSMDLTENERILGVLPMCHIYGAGVLVCTPVAMGCTAVILPKFEPKLALETIEKERVTMVPGVPAMYQFMLMELENTKYDLSSLRYCLSAAAPASQEMLDRVKQDFGCQVIEGYGMSETAGGGTVNPPNRGKLGSVGLPIPGLNICIIGDDGKPMPWGEDNVGEIAIAGGSVLLGYHNKPEATAEVMSGEWLLTGDLGYRDHDGYVFIVGRKKELIIRGGQNIYPREIEEVLIKMEGVDDAAVIGVPDRLMGERVKAFVVSKKKYTEDEVKEFCALHLASYKVPRLVEFIDELPRNSTGKLLKRMLK